MKSQRMLRIPLLLAALGAVLLLPSSVRAQQDMDPATFDIQPGVPQMDSAASLRTAQSALPAVRTEAEALAPADVTEAVQITTVDQSMILALVICAAVIVLRGIAEVRRQRMVQSAS